MVAIVCESATEVANLQPERFKVHGWVGQEPMSRLWYISCLRVM